MEPLRKQSLADDVARALRGMIEGGAFDGGDGRLPPIAQMAERFGVGRPTVREALRKLEALGLVEIRHGSGVYLRHDGALLRTNPLRCRTESPELLADVLEAREVVELHLVRLVARRARAQELERLRGVLETGGGTRGRAGGHEHFHFELARLSGNRVLQEMLQALWDLCRNRSASSVAAQAARPGNREEHLGILEALERGDEGAAVERMQAHLAALRAAVAEGAGRQGAGRGARALSKLAQERRAS